MFRREFLARGAATGAAAVALPTISCSRRPAILGEVNIILTAGTTNLVVTSLMAQMRYLEELGVAPKFINVADGNKVLAALISGSADICPAAGISQVIAAIARGAPVKIVGGAANKNFNAVFALKPEIKTLKDLEGRSVGVGALGTQLHQMMIALFRKYGVDSRKVTFANVGGGPQVFKAVKAGVVDAGPSEAWLEPGSGLHILEHGKTFELLLEYVSQAAFVPNQIIARKRELIVRTLAAYARLYRFIMVGDSEAAFIAAAAKALNKDDPDAARAQWNFYRQYRPFAADLELGEAGMTFMQQLNITTGAQKALLPFGQIADLSLAREALKLIV